VAANPKGKDPITGQVYSHVCTGTNGNVDFKRANLSGANLYGAKLDGADLSGANLARAKLDLAWIMRANFTKANPTGKKAEIDP
jgi:uncharacterized protein YjbI with pentapeptide repeats